jgi:transmembrane sensor
MTPDAKLRAALDSAWNEMREQRVLGRIVEARRQRGRRRRGLVAGAVVIAVAVAAVLATLRFSTHRAGSVAPRVADAPALQPASRITLADGSEAVLAPDGNVQIEEQSAATVHLRQRAGGVRYVVQPNPSREFVVTAEGITVRVRGTIFSVSVHSEAVEVGVERGRVEVDDGSRTRDLVAGETLRVSIGRATDGVAPDGAAAPAGTESFAVEAPPIMVAPTQNAPATTSTTTLASALLARADAARTSGRADDAAQALETFVATYPRERRVPAALFMLGRVERARGRLEAAASAFERSAEATPGGPLADDALAEAAQSWDAAGDANRARVDARTDLAAHPGGLHATAMRALIAK